MNSETATSLGDRLALKRGMRVWFRALPDAVRAAIDPERLGLEEEAAPSDGLHAMVACFDTPEALGRELPAIGVLLPPTSFAWICWPTGQGAALDADQVRAVALPLHFVETGACVLPGGWTALKLARIPERTC